MPACSPTHLNLPSPTSACSTQIFLDVSTMKALLDRYCVVSTCSRITHFSPSSLNILDFICIVYSISFVIGISHNDI